MEVNIWIEKSIFVIFIKTNFILYFSCFPYIHLKCIRRRTSNVETNPASDDFWETGTLCHTGRGLHVDDVPTALY